MPLRLLVLDAYAPEGRAALRDAGGTEAGELYHRMLARHAPDARIDVVHPADGASGLPGPDELADYDGVAWTGSSLTIHHADDPRVARQVDFARRVYAAGVPSFGSCWAVQLAVVAAGGRCAPNPKGREFGVARRIALSAAGRTHPLFDGKPAVFDAFTSHADHVSEPARARTLASNAWSPVQAVDVTADRGRFWAVQYHPEYDPHEVASLCRLRRDELVGQGSFPDREAAERFVEDLEVLQRDPGDRERAAALGLDDSVLDPALREREVRNWLASLGPTALHAGR